VPKEGDTVIAAGHPGLGNSYCIVSARHEP